MNKVIMTGRLTRDPEIRYGGQDNQTAIARFSIAVDRRFRRAGESADADFFNCTAFGKQAEFVERYMKKGMKVDLSGRLQNDNYTNREGQKVNNVQIIVEDIEFGESRSASQGRTDSYQAASKPAANAVPDGFINVPDEVEDEELPFN